MVAQLESPTALDPAQKAKTLICALNLISRNLPLPPDVFNAVSSIYQADDSPDRAQLDPLGASSDQVPVRPPPMPPLGGSAPLSAFLLWFYMGDSCFVLVSLAPDAGIFVCLCVILCPFLKIWGRSLRLGYSGLMG